ncbi:hypothetical protein PanWU01x14_019280 [Parasponia andersonii]|uniref:Wall-associated receptor kinase, galacturonan-binding domain containing protein n=1 Tax=Parasponia andersonii TaxID=3476 RepID=A0A2P5DZH3_PARAD|nr:hypothetical protein PanWU01x14_019280 [Parasponia andersonii]
MYQLHSGPSVGKFSMALIRLFVFFSLTHLVLLSSAEEENDNPPCSPFLCGSIPFPYNNKTHPECSTLTVYDCSEDIHTIRLKEGGHRYQIEKISQAHSIVINETLPLSTLTPHNCESIKSFSLPSSSPSLSFYFTGKHLTLYNCSHSIGGITPPRDFSKTVCEGFDIYHHLQNSSFPFEKQCSIMQLPLPEDQDPKQDNIPLLTTRVIFEVFVPPYCLHCQRDEGECQTDSKHCPNTRKGIYIYQMA